jgi:hypothetical protein
MGTIPTTVVAWFYRNRCHRDSEEKGCELHGVSVFGWTSEM